MGVLKSDYPIVSITIQRWQKDWIQSQHALNFSGLVQEMLNELIRMRDPQYFEMHTDKLDQHVIQRKELIKTIVSHHSNKYSNI